MRVISNIKSYLRQRPAMVSVLLSPKRLYFTVTGKGWIIGWDDNLPFLSVPLVTVAFNRHASPWRMFC